MNKDIRISVITVSYNAAATIERTLKSVAGQTYPHVEYILIDGHSTDGTTALIRRYESHIDYWVSEPDKGLYDAMNKGLAQAHGDYVCFLNAGDTFAAPSTLAEIADRIKAASVLPDVVYGDTALVDDQGHYCGMRRHPLPDRLTWKTFRRGMLVCHQAFFAHRDLTLPYDCQYRFSADFDWCIRVLRRSQSTLNMQQTLIHYLNEGMTTRNHKASLKERFHIMVRHYGWLTTSVMHLWFVFRSIGYKMKSR